MASVKLRTYFDTEANNPVLTPESKVECVSSVLHCEQRVKKAIIERKIAIGPRAEDLSEAIEKLKRKLNFDLEEQIKLERRKEAKRMEDELKQRLELVQETITTLGPAPEEHKATKLKLLSKEVREAVQLTEKEKAKEAKLWAARLREEQKIRDRNRLKVVEEISAECEAERREEEARREEAEREKEVRMKQRVEYMKTLSTRRHQQLAEIKEIIKTSKVPKRSISESPSEEHRHHPEPTHVSISQIVKEHSNKYKEAKQTYEAKRFQQLITQKMTESVQGHKQAHYFFDVASEKRALQAEEKRKSVLKEELQTKQKRYASLIKEMYAPVIDHEKQQQLEKLKSRIHTIPRSTRPIDRSLRPHSLMTSHTDSLESELSTALSHPKKPKSVTLAEEESIKRPNYLPSVRQSRIQHQNESRSRTNPALTLLSSQLSDLSGNGDTDELLYKANLLERKAIKQAKLLRSSDPMNLANLEEADGVDSALLMSVKAKLSLLSA